MKQKVEEENQSSGKFLYSAKSKVNEGYSKTIVFFTWLNISQRNPGEDHLDRFVLIHFSM